MLTKYVAMIIPNLNKNKVLQLYDVTASLTQRRFEMVLYDVLMPGSLI